MTATITRHCTCSTIRDIFNRVVKRSPAKDCPVHAPCSGHKCGPTTNPHCPLHGILASAVDTQLRETERILDVRLPGSIEHVEVTVSIEAEACGTCGTRAVTARRCSFCGARA